MSGSPLTDNEERGTDNLLAPRWTVSPPRRSVFESSLALGLGLIGIGKPWGHLNPEVPEDEAVQRLLSEAVQLGIRYFDTAPSYGCSEVRLADFLQQLPGEQRNGLVIATKFGEHWNSEQEAPFVDHTYDALARSLERSLERLQGIDFLQLHKTTPAALRSPDVERAFRFATDLGIRNIGASVSDLASAEIALETRLFSIIQLPLNPASRQFLDIAARAAQAGFLVVTNRPFGMGSLLYGDEPVAPRDAFAWLKLQRLRGVVLTGTKSIEHLRENWAAFHEGL